MRRLPLLLIAALLSACAAPPPAPPIPTPVLKPPLKIALALGGGAGSVVGALYASGMSGFDLQNLALQMEEGMLADWTLPNRGMLKGEALQDFINQNVKNLAIQKMPKPLGVVATDLQNGERVLFRRGDTGMAVRASSAVPGMLQAVEIGGRDYVDGASPRRSRPRSRAAWARTSSSPWTSPT